MAVSVSFNPRDIGRVGFDGLFGANWISLLPSKPDSTVVGFPRSVALVSGLSWERAKPGGDAFPAALFSDENFAMFSGSRNGAVVAGGTLYRADSVVGISNVTADVDEAPAVWRDLSILAASTVPGRPRVGYESGGALTAPRKGGVCLGEPEGRGGKGRAKGQMEHVFKGIVDQFDREATALYGTAHLWDDGIIDPRDTRRVLAFTLSIARESIVRPLNPITFGVARM